MLIFSRPVVRVLRCLLLTATALFFCLHFVHLSADFPNFSPWMDWSKYTDEGWYGDAAIRHYQLGHWYVPGDFNPAAALPVWPLLEAVVFRFTGVSLVAARALTVLVFGGILGCSYLLLRRWGTRGSLAPEAGVALLVVSPFCFVFTRLAILEPLLVLITLLLMLFVGLVKVQHGDEIRANIWPMVGMGVLLPLLILTKTTGLFLVPAIVFLLFAAVGYRVGSFLRVGCPAAGLGAVLWLTYYGLVVKPHYLLDYRYLFSANGYTQITLATAATVLQKTFMDGAWMGRGVYVGAVACAVLAVVFWRRLGESPLIGALLLWAVGYEAFLAYHNNLQPRYYLVVAVPLTLLIPATVEQLVLPRFKSATVRRGVWWAVAAALVGIAALQARQTISFLRHPEYTLLQAAHEVQDVISTHQKEDPKHSPLVLSISGSNLSLMTGMPSIDDDFGTLELVDRVRQYRPGWYVAWNQIDDDKMDALTPFYHIERVAAFPAMDDPDRNLLIVYRLDDSVETAFRKRHGKPTPKGLRTKVGQQPSISQLQH
jgi:hypothetical protein